jgi:hypothetical protein
MWAGYYCGGAERWIMTRTESISERARSGVTDMPERERPISEQFRIVAKQWAEANAAAKLLEETRQSVFSRIVMNRREERIAAVDAKAVRSMVLNRGLGRVVEPPAMGAGPGPGGSTPMEDAG